MGIFHRIVSRMSVIVTAALLLAAASGAGFAGKVRICVIAVRDSGLFTMCPSSGMIKEWRYPGRTPSLEIIQNPEGPRLGLPQHIIRYDRPVLDRTRAEWWRIIGRLPGYCPSGRIDLELKQSIEREIAKHSDFVLAAAPEQADQVFLAEGLYADQSAGFIGVQSSRYRASAIPMLAAVMAIAVPAATYAQNPADSEILLEARIWEGSAAWKSEPPATDRQPASAPASIEGLVSRFVDRRDAMAAFPPLCAPRILAPSVDALGALRARAAAKTSGSSSPAPAANAGAISLPGSTFKVDVSLVAVPAMVNDAAGMHIQGLREKDFHLFENGIEQQIDRVIPEVTPFNVVLMLDTSGSTMLNHDEIQKAALAFVETLRPEERVMVVSFDSQIYLDAVLTADRAVLRRAILQMDTGSGTRLYDALDIVLEDCLGRIEGRKAIVLFTDGIDSQSWLARLGNYGSKVEESDAVLYCIQFDSLVASSASKLLKDIAENSGGRLFQASTTTNLEGAFKEIANELRRQYTLCYYPASSLADSAFRQIRVTVDRPDAQIRARTGYRFSAR